MSFFKRVWATLGPGARGAFAALAAVYPAAFLTALVWRFPIPFSGFESGIGAAVRSVIAVTFYGLFGGFVVVPIAGAVAGSLAGRERSVKAGCAAALFCTLLLSVWDKIYGPF
jgi:hypothetical protein